MSSYTRLFCFAVDWHQLSQLLGQSNTTALTEEISATGKQTPKAKKKLEQELAQHLPWLERIMKGVPAVDPDLFGDEDDEVEDDEELEMEIEVSIQEIDLEKENEDNDEDYEDEDEDELPESESYLDAFDWMCERLGRSIPISESLFVWSIVQYDYFGFTEALKRFQSPFPLPKLDDNGALVGFIPNSELAKFEFKSIDPKREEEIQNAIKEIESIAEDSNEEKDESDVGDEEEEDEDLTEDFTSFMAERMLRDFKAPDQAEIELAHDELSAIFADIHKLGKDFVGIIRTVS